MNIQQLHWLFIYLFVYLFIYLFIYLFNYLFIYLINCSSLSKNDLNDFFLYINSLQLITKVKNTHILTAKKHRQIKLQRLQKVQIWASLGSLEHQINSLKEVLKLKENFHKNKVVHGETLFFVIGPFCTQHSTCLNIVF